MSITINGSGTLTGVSVGGLPDGIVDADTLATDAVTTVKIEDDAVTDAKQDLSGAAKAWVTIDGLGTGDLRIKHFNVSGVTDSGTGRYSVSFTNSFSDTGYCVVTGGYNTFNGDGSWNAVGNGTNSNYPAALSTGGVELQCFNGSGNAQDQHAVFVAVFGD